MGRVPGRPPFMGWRGSLLSRLLTIFIMNECQVLFLQPVVCIFHGQLWLFSWDPYLEMKVKGQNV